jgi:flagellar basal-body rod protein FlgF
MAASPKYYVKFEPMLLRLQNSSASMAAMGHQQERTANNLANANTIGYKRDRMFTEVLNEHLDNEGAPQSQQLISQWAALDQGSMEATGNPLDLAISGEGFFVLLDDATGTERYTRAGRFTVDEEGTLRDPLGFTVDGTVGPIQIPRNASTIEISRTGEIRSAGELIGQLRIVGFEQPLQLRRLEGAAFAAAGMEPVDLDNPAVLQGYVENSNVDAIGEMTEMITHFRIYEAHQKLLQAHDQVLGQVTQNLGKF